MAEITLSGQIEALIADNAILKESFQAATSALLSLQVEDENWQPLYGRENPNEEFSLHNLREVRRYANLQTVLNPLLNNGLRVRTANVFGKGLKFEAVGADKIQPRFQKIMDKPINKNALFTQEAYDKNEREAYIAGNLYFAFDSRSDTYFAIPFEQITATASNPAHLQDLWYIQRTYTQFDYSTGELSDSATVEWYPILEHWEEGPNKLAKTIQNQKVNAQVRVVDFRVNAAIGNVFGTPDCLAAMPYAWAHAEYIRDASKLLKALATIAWKVTTKSKGNAANAAAKANSPKGSASTAVMTDNTDMVAMPRSGQVDMTDGQVIASYVAAALGISLVALLQDAGAASGSYGAAATLDGPSANTARTRQGLWVTFYERIYRCLGVKEINVNFPKLQEDPIFRTQQSLTMAFAGGAISQQEFRDATLELLDIKADSSVLPVPSPFTAGAQYSLEGIAATEKIAQAAADKASAAADNSNPANVTGQGQATGIGKLSNGDNSTRDQAAKPGTGA